MHVVELLKQHEQEVTFSVEITPPIRGTSIDSIFEIIETILPYHPLWIDVTSHAADVEWVNQGDQDVIEKRLQRRSPGTIAICGAIEHKFGIPMVPHLLCSGFTREETEDALIDLNYLGIDNVLAIRGDGPPKDLPMGRSANNYAIDLVKQIKSMNRGKYLEQAAQPTNFSVGVSCYPEKHFQAPSFESDISHFLNKQEVGADYAVTQMFFDNQKYFDFIDRLESRINIPIIPAFKILTSDKQLETIKKYFHVDFPNQLVDRMENAKTPDNMEAVGVQWAYEQCLELLDRGHKHFHFYIMKKTVPLLAVLQRLATYLNQE